MNRNFTSLAVTTDAGAGLDTAFATQLAARLEQAHGAAAARRWAPWHREIFADAWSVMTMGTGQG